MCNIDKYKKIYKDIEQLSPEDTLNLVLSADDPAEQEFFELLGDYLLQRKQKEVIEANQF